MKKLIIVGVSVALLSANLFAVAEEDKKCGHGMTRMKNMDTDNDGTVSKEEFMTAHEAMWDKLKKNKDGLVDVKEMQKMHKCMKHGKDDK